VATVVLLSRGWKWFKGM